MTVSAEPDSLGPRLQQHTDGRTILSWMTRESKGASLYFAPFFNDGWQDSQHVIHDPDMFVNWADKPAVTPVDGGGIVAHWLSYSADETYSYDTMIARSSDAGRTFTAAETIHNDGTTTEHGFVSVFSMGNSRTGFLWLDGRKTKNASGGETVNNGMTLRAAQMDANGNIDERVLIDDLVCDCCQTDVAITDLGPIAIYRDRSADEIRDIYVARHIDNTWQAGTALANDNWEIAGCPVNGPEIDTRESLVAIAWFTAANDDPMVKVAISKNSGKTFSDPIIVASENTSGAVEIAIIDDQSFAVSWVDKEDDGSIIQLRSLTFDGEMGPVKTVGRASSRSMAPEMVRVGDQLVLAWADTIGENSKIQTIRVPILGFFDR